MRPSGAGCAGRCARCGVLRSAAGSRERRRGAARRREDGGMIETVLVATDGSDAAAAAERYGVALAARLQARVAGVSVVEERITRGFRSEGLGIPVPALEALEGFLAARAEAACRRLAAAAREKGAESSSETPRGVADDVIVERAKQADLIVLRRHGEHAGFRTALIGSTADGVLRKTSKPVMVVPQSAELAGPVLLAFDGSPGSRTPARPPGRLGRPPRRHQPRLAR